MRWKKILSEKQREIVRYWLKAIPAYFFQSNLTRLAQWYGTDKYEHGYTPIYQRYFQSIRRHPIRLLELGIGGGSNTKYGGNSLKMWSRYFSYGEILGVDIYDKSLIDYRRIRTYQGHQSDPDFLKQFAALDIVIDDGSHINSDIISSFEFLFPRLNRGGIYTIEDTHTSGVTPFHQDRFPATMEYFEKLDHAEIEAIHFFKSLIIIQKLL